MSTEASQSKPYMTAKELGLILGKHERTILDWATDELIPCVRLTKRTIFFIESDVRASLLARNIPHAKKTQGT